jgi:hypothetical protein
MSYCAFENTNLALDQLTDMIGEALDENEPLEMSSPYEASAFRSIRGRMQDLLDLLKEYDASFPPATSDS